MHPGGTVVAPASARSPIISQCPMAEGKHPRAEPARPLLALFLAFSLPRHRHRLRPCNNKGRTQHTQHTFAQPMRLPYVRMPMLYAHGCDAQQNPLPDPMPTVHASAQHAAHKRPPRASHETRDTTSKAQVLNTFSGALGRYSHSSPERARVNLAKAHG